ncbi:MAG TPA: hypothetical protein DCX80_06555 [Chloroflexi bacterium]|nr:hypothetical protein [Chloroflexota bacterium]
MISHLYQLDPGFADDLPESVMRDIVRANSAGRYEDITGDEIGSMIMDCYLACGADEATARWLTQH